MSSSSGGKDFHGGGDKRKTYAAWEKYDVDAALGETEKAERREDRVAATAKGHSRVAKVETTAAQEAVVGAGVLESRASVEALKARLKRGGGGGGGRGGRRRGRGGDSDDDNSGSSSSSGGDSSGGGGDNPREKERHQAWLQQLAQLAAAASRKAKLLSAAVAERDEARAALQAGRPDEARALFRAAVRHAEALARRLRRMRTEQQLADAAAAAAAEEDEAAAAAAAAAAAGGASAASAGNNGNTGNKLSAGTRRSLEKKKSKRVRHMSQRMADRRRMAKEKKLPGKDDLLKLARTLRLSALLGLGEAALRCHGGGRSAEASDALKAVLLDRGTDVQAWLLRGEAWVAMELPLLAALHFSRALELDRKNEDTQEQVDLMSAAVAEQHDERRHEGGARALRDRDDDGGGGGGGGGGSGSGTAAAAAGAGAASTGSGGGGGGIAEEVAAATAVEIRRARRIAGRASTGGGVAPLLRYGAALRRDAEAAYDEGYFASAASKFDGCLACLDRARELAFDDGSGGEGEGEGEGEGVGEGGPSLAPPQGGGGAVAAAAAGAGGKFDSVREPAAARRARFACYVNIAGCHLQLHGRASFGRAARACRQAIALEPSSVLAHFRLAQALAAAGGGGGVNFEEALKFYRRALRFCRAEAKQQQQPQQQLKKAKAWCAEIKAAIGQCEFQRKKHRMPPAAAAAAVAAAEDEEKADAGTAVVVVEAGSGDD